MNAFFRRFTLKKRVTNALVFSSGPPPKNALDLYVEGVLSILPPEEKNRNGKLFLPPKTRLRILRLQEALFGKPTVANSEE
jgi:hypothetical protein